MTEGYIILYSNESAPLLLERRKQGLNSHQHNKSDRLCSQNWCNDLSGEEELQDGTGVWTAGCS